MLWDRYETSLQMMGERVIFHKGPPFIDITSESGIAACKQIRLLDDRGVPHEIRTGLPVYMHTSV